MEGTPDDKRIGALFEERIASLRSDYNVLAIAWLKKAHRKLIKEIETSYNDLLTAGSDMASQPEYVVDPLTSLDIRTPSHPRYLIPYESALQRNLEEFLRDRGFTEMSFTWIQRPPHYKDVHCDVHIRFCGCQIPYTLDVNDSDTPYLIKLSEATPIEDTGNTQASPKNQSKEASLSAEMVDSVRSIKTPPDDVDRGISEWEDLKELREISGKANI